MMLVGAVKDGQNAADEFRTRRDPHPQLEDPIGADALSTPMLNLKR
jgi:hypothetical protein